MKRQFLVLALATLAAGAASAKHTKGGTPSPAPPSTVTSAPELDPGSMIAGLTLLTGAAMVLAGRRRIKSS